MKIKILLNKINEDILKNILQYNVKSINRILPNKYEIEFEILKKDNAYKTILDIFSINSNIIDEEKSNIDKRGDFYY